MEVIADLGEAAHPRYRYGSGCVVTGRTVLTAAHVVKGSVSVTVRDPDKVMHEAALDPGFVGDVNGPGPDLALVEIIGPGIDVPKMGLAAVDRDSVSGDPVEGCHAVGYPAFMERDTHGGRFRETVDAFGHVPALSGLAGGLLSVQVSSAPRPLPPGQTALGESEWSGMSGGPVVAGGLLLGVVTEHAQRAGPSVIMATPLTALEEDPGHLGWGPGVADPGAWWARLGGSGAQALRRLPVPQQRAEPVYWATVRDIHQRTRMLVGRQKELAEIASFAAGAEGYRWLAGGAWAGKTSLLAEAVTELRGECDVVCYFLSRRETDADSSLFLAAVVPQLAFLLEEDPPVAELHQFRALWQRAAQRADAYDRHLLLVVDGLDEDLRPRGLPSVAALLPSVAGVRAHVLVSSRPYFELPADLPPGHPLVHTQPVQVEPFAGGRELAALARQEIDDLLRRDDDGLAADVLGLLTAAAGPLAVDDLATLTADLAPVTPAQFRRVDRLVSENARSLRPVGPANYRRYQFAHGSLLEQAQIDGDLRILRHPDFRRRIDRWADDWCSRRWRDGGGAPVPAYLLESYPATLVPGSGQDGDLGRLAALTSDVGWTAAAVRALGIDQVLAILRTAGSVLPDNRHRGGGNGEMTIARLASALRAQSYALRSPQITADEGFALRHLCMHGMTAGDRRLEAECTARLLELPPPQLVPKWTTIPAGRLLTRQFGQIVSVSVSADGSRTVVGTGYKVQVFDHDGLLLHSLAPAGLHLHAAAISADGRHVAAVGSGMELGLFNAETGTLTGRLRPVRSWSLGLSGDGAVVVFDREGPAGIWHTAETRPRTIPTPQGRPDAVGVSGDGRRVVTCRKNGQPVVWDEATGKLYAPAESHLACAVAISADGAVAVSGDANGTLRAWDVMSRQSIGTRQPHHDQITAIAVAADGSLAVAGDEAGRLLRWDITRQVVVSVVAHLGAVSAIAVTADGGRMLSGGADGTVWDRDALSAAGDSTFAGRPPAGPAHVLGLGESVVVTSGEKALLQVRDLVTREPIRDLAGPADGAPMGPIHAVAASPDGSVIAAVGQDPRVLGWGSSDPTPAVLRGHRSELYAVAVTCDGTSVFAGDARGVTVGWDLVTPTHALLPVTYDAPGTVTALAVSSDGCWLVCGTDRGEVWRWQVATGTGEMILPRPDDPSQLDPRVNAVAVSRDGSRITVVNVDGRLRSWVNGVAAREVPGRGLNQVWTAAVDGTAAMIDDHIWLQVNPAAGAPLHAVTPAPATAVALGPSRQGEPRSLAVAHPGGAVTMFQLIG